MTCASVLVVDDDSNLLEMVSRILRRAGYRVQTANSGEKALRILDPDAPPDLLITDIFMPDIEGAGLIRAVRGPFPTMPILAISGQPRLRGLDVLGMMLQLGADAVLAKPFSGHELIEVVQRLTAPASP